MPFDTRVTDYYETQDEGERLRRPGLGDLIRLRSWDVFDRFLPAPPARIADVGGGPGVHAAHLAARGHDVVLLDPVPRHVAAARALGVPAAEADARRLPLADASMDAVLLMGPLYHLTDPADRRRALTEAQRVLRPGGTLIAEVITRHAWVMEATLRGLLDDEEVWAEFERIDRIGLTQDPAGFPAGGFWAYLQPAGEFHAELADAGLTGIRLVTVEGFAHLLPGLPALMRDQPAELLRAVRLTESEPSMLGVGPHLFGIATKKAGPS
ncbi:MAG: class I SAM-dependent methyltransferase [Actinoplanes sp.]